jgi:transposase
MTEEDYSAILGDWQGYRFGAVGRREGLGKGVELWIELIPKRKEMMRCSGCDKMVSGVHDLTERFVRDLPVLDATTVLLVHRRRVNCPHCGPKVEALDWLEPYARVTNRLSDSVARLCEVLPIRHAAQHFDLHWDTVKAIHKKWLKSRLEPFKIPEVETIVMDEFALHKGRRYATVIMEPVRKQVLWVGRGRSREDIRPFFEALGEKGRKRLQAVAMDMNGAYEKEVQAQCPHARIVYDLFHVVAKYGKEVIRRVRVDEAKRLDKSNPLRKVIRSANWLLLRRKKNIVNQQERVTLTELLKANRRLMTVYVLGEDLRRLWEYRYEGAARRFWKQWYSRAIRSQIPALKLFARRMQERIEGILAHCHWPLHTSLIEGVNNKIKVIKRMAYGFRDHEYFFLRIRSAFPGNP